jgi:uncharacterized membrane protein
MCDLPSINALVGTVVFIFGFVLGGIAGVTVWIRSHD